MLELQSLQKEKRREQLFKLQTNNDSTSASKKTSFITSQDYAKTDLDCFDDASIDDSTTLADDIILLNTDSSNESSRKDSHTELITVLINQFDRLNILHEEEKKHFVIVFFC